MGIVPTKKVSDEFLQSLPIVGEKPKSEKEEKYLREIQEFEFYNLEEPGVTHTFSYGGGGKTHVFNFFHGGKYRLPRFIARHVEGASTPIWAWRPTGIGTMDKQNIGKKPRFRMTQSFAA